MFAWGISFWKFRLETLARGSQACGTGLLRLGETLIEAGGKWWLYDVTMMPAWCQYGHYTIKSSECFQAIAKRNIPSESSKRYTPNESYQAKVTKRKCPDEQCKANVPKRQFQSDSLKAKDSQAKDPKRTFPTDRCQTNVAEQQIPNENSQEKMIKSTLPSENSQTTTVPKRNPRTKVSKPKFTSEISKRMSPNNRFPNDII